MSQATFQEIQETDEYTSGYALRVPKFVRSRPDKKVDEIDDLEKLHKLHEIPLSKPVIPLVFNSNLAEQVRF